MNQKKDPESKKSSKARRDFIIENEGYMERAYGGDHNEEIHNEHKTEASEESKAFHSTFNTIGIGIIVVVGLIAFFFIVRSCYKAADYVVEKTVGPSVNTIIKENKKEQTRILKELTIDTYQDKSMIISFNYPGVFTLKESLSTGKRVLGIELESTDLPYPVLYKLEVLVMRVNESAFDNPSEEQWKRLKDFVKKDFPDNLELKERKFDGHTGSYGGFEIYEWGNLKIGYFLKYNNSVIMITRWQFEEELYNLTSSYWNLDNFFINVPKARKVLSPVKQ